MINTMKGKGKNPNPNPNPTKTLIFSYFKKRCMDLKLRY